MPRSLSLLFTLATLSATAAIAQSANGPANITDPSPSTYMQSQPAPIERGYTAALPANDNNHARNHGVRSSQPIQGVWLRVAPDASVQTVSANADGTELRVEKGIANVIVQHPADNVQILVDLPGGQTTLVKDGTYTFNAATNTVRVLDGEADAFTAASNSTKGIKLKSDEQYVFGSSTRAMEANSGQLRADVLAGGEAGRGYGAQGYGGQEYGYPVVAYGGYAPYGYGYPAFGYPYDYGFGYPFGVGIGFGYYGGFGGYYGRGYGYGGFWGGFGGFHGGHR